jgi:hypothetical protein
MFAISFRIFRH